MKKRIIWLVNPCPLEGPFRFLGQPVSAPPNLGVVGSMIASVIDRENLKGTIEIRFIDEVRGGIVKAGKDDLVLITTLIGTQDRATELSENCVRSGAQVLLGGADATLRSDLYLGENDNIHVFLGQAANSDIFRKLVKEYLGTGRLEKRVYRSESVGNHSIINLEGLPVDYSVWQQIDQGTILPFVLASDGCIYSCKFCAVNALSGKSIRIRPVAEVIDEIKERRLDGFSLADSNVALNPEFDHLVEELSKLKLRKGWTAELSMNFLRNEKIFQKLGKSGCQRILVGVESPDIVNLKNAGKRQNLDKDRTITEQTRQIVAYAHKYNIKVTLLLIVGFPEDTLKKILSLAEFINYTKADGASISILTPFPGTEIWDDFQKQGLFNPEEFPSSRFDMRHLVWKHPLGKIELLRAYFDLCKKVWHPFRIIKRSLKSFALSNPLDWKQKFASSFGFEILSRKMQLHPWGDR